MRKIKFIMLSIAIIATVGAALANKSKAPCSDLPQYYKSGNNFYPAGIENFDYQCEFDHFGTCTYYYDASTKTYKPCKWGKIVWLR